MTSPSEIFGRDVFDLDTMKKRLPKATYRALKSAIDRGTKLTLPEADAIAHIIMEWAVSKGATHYTHWFQPMTGLTAQKHDAFFTFDSNMSPIERFSGAQLIQSEPDASSFPSGGMRTTFEARGYTAWDPSSPVFILRNGKVPFLCIPSVFFSYTGQALDKKTPLLRSVKALNDAAAKAVKLLTGKDVRVNATVGAEQEYFLVDRKYFERRPDLVMAGRTVIGSRPAKGQQLEDHYFGAVKDRVLNYMADVETRLYELGVPIKTRHNEVAPHQYETAPVFETANLACDHNQLTMDVLKRVALEHGLAALMHEKPFAEVNGSGKHLNWSMSTSGGDNLLEPGKAPHQKLEFLYFLVAVINAVHKRGAVLRSTIASAGNDHRLGANEAPPAIMSVFLGDHLSKILDAIETAEDFTPEAVNKIDLGLTELPDIQVDNTDRNRTSPFAFTGNKFEFRALGANQSISIPAAMLNAAVADSINELNAELEKLKKRDEKSVLAMLRPFIKRSKPIRFEGNNYSDEWREEAERRGLRNLLNTASAYSVWEEEDTRAFITGIGLLNREEMDAQMDVRLDHYAKTIGLEASVMVNLVDNYVLPVSFRYQARIASSVRELEAALGETGDHSDSLKEQRNYLAKISKHIGGLLAERRVLDEKLQALEEQSDEKAMASYAADVLVPMMERVREHCDAIESLADAETWELPNYHELLFLM